MNRYKIVRKKVFERQSAFEERLNSLSLEGWRAISISSENGGMVVLMEKSR